MVSRNFLIQQATLNAIDEAFPSGIAFVGPVYMLKTVERFIDRDQHWFCQSVRKHFNILDRRARERQDAQRLLDWRGEVIWGNFK